MNEESDNELEEESEREFDDNEKEFDDSEKDDEDFDMGAIGLEGTEADGISSEEEGRKTDGICDTRHASSVEQNSNEGDMQPDSVSVFGRDMITITYRLLRSKAVKGVVLKTKAES